MLVSSFYASRRTQLAEWWKRDGAGAAQLRRSSTTP